MDELSEKLNQILSNKESMDRVREMAESLLGGQKDDQPEPDIDMGKIVYLINKMKQSGGERENLLLALRPHLREERRARLDTAVKILKLIEIAPLIKDSGIFG